MTTSKLEYIRERLSDEKLRKNLSRVIKDIEALIPLSEEEFADIQKFGLYPAEECVTFFTKQGSPFYHLDNMSLVPKGDTSNYIRYGDFEFRQLEILYHMARMDSIEAQQWLKDNLFQGCRVDARKKRQYKLKFKECERADWRDIQVEWMKYCLNLKYSCNALFRKDLFDCRGKLPVENATTTNYDSNLFWGAALVEVDGKQYYFGCNVVGKLLFKLRENGGTLPYTLPDDLTIFGKAVIK